MVIQPGPKPTQTAGWRAFIRSHAFGRAYALLAVALLLVTTLFWSIKGAILQQGNADELVDPHLFENAHTFNEALLSGSHTFLLKWPLFWLIKLFNFSELAFVAVTVLVVLATLAGLVWLIYRIEHRPLFFGTICLALASSLLLVPARPYAGGLLPVNMAMLTTRNLEYLLYMGSLLLLIKSPRIKSYGFWLSVAGLSLLIAGDKLFMSLSAGGAILALLFYALTRDWKFTGLAARWLVTSVLASLGALGILWLVQASKVTHVASQSAAAPFGLIHSLHDLVLGLLYGSMGLATNFGANPAYDSTIVRHIPHQLLARLISPGGPAYLVNILLLLAGTYMSWSLLKSSLVHTEETASQNAGKRGASTAVLALMLLWSSLAAIVVFVSTNHYFAVDSRYLGIVLFAVFLAAATYTSKHSWQPEKLVLAGLILFVAIICGVFYANRLDRIDRQVLANINQRNASIAQAVESGQIKLLVGDYWRVLPIKQTVGNQLTVTPLNGCTQPLSVLSSRAWMPDLHKNSFAYLLSLDQNFTGYSTCSLKQIVSAYGRPNSSVLIEGTILNPVEILLIYTHGIRHHITPRGFNLPPSPSTVVPIDLSQLPSPSCNVPTIMTVVAHEDDDLLFMNPDLLHDIKSGNCVRTVYVTAGDAGNSKFYWLSRQLGSEAAYSTITPVKDDLWVERIVKLAPNEFITVANPKNNPKVTLVFIHLPDGDLDGKGFKATGYESLVKLEAAKISALHSVDGQSFYSNDQLISVLTSLMHFFQPTEIWTQANFVGRQYPDHSDHMAVGRYVKKAYASYESQQYENRVTIPLKFYIGYPVHQMPPNISGSDLQAKEAAFFSYANFDKGVCHSPEECKTMSTFGFYLERQYQNPY